MRLNISNDKDTLVNIVCHYLSNLLTERKVDLIINGTKTTGLIKSVNLKDEDESYIVIKINKETKEIPLLNDTKARFGKDLVVIETKTHATVIEILD